MVRAPQTYLLLFGVAVALSACRAGENTPQGTAERFVDQYYVRIDLKTAAQYCTGLALEKVQHSLQLTQGQGVDEGTRKPSVGYTLIEKKDADDTHAAFVFQGTVAVPDAGEMHPKWLITTAKSGDAWKVTNFEEF